MVNQEEKKKTCASFSQRLFWSVFSMFLGFTACFFLFQYEREREFVQEKLNSLLSNYNYQIYQLRKRNADFDNSLKQFLQGIPQNDLRVTVISPNGDVIYDNSLTNEPDNHNDRSEVRKARIYKEGYAVRKSGSIGIRYFYAATNIDQYIYRSALPYEPYAQEVFSINKDFIYFMALMTLLFFFVLSRFTFSIGKTISKLRDFALNTEKGNVGEMDYLFPNDELGDISRNIISLYNRQQKAANDLSVEREKLVKHFQYAKEGFAMFTAEGKEILSNVLFIQLLNLISDRQINLTEEVLGIHELQPICSFLLPGNMTLASKRKVMRNSITVDKNGKIFLVECLLFLDNSYEISISDISRQEEENRMKRQLTQNVAHELKTPVSSIQGYLETIIENPSLTEEKRRFFMERCYTQSTRLTGLLRDISVLNRLDEASNMFELTDVEIAKLVGEMRKECFKEMEDKRITCDTILPGNPVVHGNYSLLYSIFRNLFDNSIAYAGEGIHITLSCYREDSTFYYFSFADNGIGVSEEHINRIFERFYRVDKGRSRKIGGTGLGLSIVKNGVSFHKGKIYAKSSSGKGLTIFFMLKKRLS